MISCRTQGRLGNWLFQFSATYTHARKYGYDYQMPVRSYNEQLWPTPKFSKVVYGKPFPGKTYYEQGHAYAPIPAEDNLILEGYWQSELYWHGYHDRIAALLDFPERSQQFCAVHVRRGDYLQFPDQFPVLPVEYYLNAIEEMKGRNWTHFVFFSDDIPWCRAAFGSGYTYTLGQPLSDMKEIYTAEAAIISNSTFSLFPALLDREKEVIAPAESRWYGPKAKLSTETLMNEKWMKI